MNELHHASTRQVQPSGAKLDLVRKARLSELLVRHISPRGLQFTTNAPEEVTSIHASLNEDFEVRKRLAS